MRPSWMASGVLLQAPPRPDTGPSAPLGVENSADDTAAALANMGAAAILAAAAAATESPVPLPIEPPLGPSESADALVYETRSYAHAVVDFWYSDHGIRLDPKHNKRQPNKARRGRT